jgi:hypothetical protein
MPPTPPVATTGWTSPGEPKPSGWTEPKGSSRMTGCVVVLLIGIGAFLVLIIALIYLGSQISTILSTVGDSI